ncbi:hypothetical protein VTI74DRAFT_9566 [Chaetomium olivicolor]
MQDFEPDGKGRANASSPDEPTEEREQLVIHATKPQRSIRPRCVCARGEPPPSPFPITLAPVVDAKPSATTTPPIFRGQRTVQGYAFFQVALSSASEVYTTRALHCCNRHYRCCVPLHQEVATADRCDQHGPATARPVSAVSALEQDRRIACSGQDRQDRGLTS